MSMKPIKIIKIQDGIVTAKILDDKDPLNTIRFDEMSLSGITIHAHWEDCSNGWMCSNCYRDSTYDTKYCPHCGAKMDEEVEIDE